MKKALLTVGAMVCFAGFARATISFDIEADQLSTSGGAAAPTSTLVMLVADTGGDGFGAIQASRNLTVGSFLDANNNDKIIYKSNIAAGGAGVGTFIGAPTLTLDSGSGSGFWNVGNGLALVWFPTLTTSSTQTTANDSYGLFSGPAANGSSAWVTPNNGTSSYKLYDFNSNASVLAGGISSPSGSTGFASSSVAAAPEPSRIMLGAMGLGAFLMRRRRAA